MITTTRINVTISKAVLEKLDVYCKEMGVSRSAALSTLSMQALKFRGASFSAAALYRPKLLAFCRAASSGQVPGDCQQQDTLHPDRASY